MFTKCSLIFPLFLLATIVGLLLDASCHSTPQLVALVISCYVMEEKMTPMVV